MGSHQDFREVLKMLWAGKIKPVIHQVMPLSEGVEAYKQMQGGRHFGKIVLVPF
jgi:NADPH:quinone reductase-like Zn-dependent oxidoreductase